MDENFGKRLLQLAQQQDAVRKRALELIDMIEVNHAAHIAPYEAELERIRTDVAETERQLRADLLSYMTETGDLHVHPSVGLRRTKTVAYDKAQVVETLKARGMNEFLRVRVELDARAFEKAVRAGDVDLVEVEVVNDPTIVIDRLGDLLIAFEAGRIDEDGNFKEA